MKVRLKIPRGRNSSPSLRKKISMPDWRNTPLGPSLRLCSSTNRSRYSANVSAWARQIRYGPASASSLRALRRISCRSFAGSAFRNSSYEPGSGRKGATPLVSSATSTWNPCAAAASASRWSHCRSSGRPRRSASDQSSRRSSAAGSLGEGDRPHVVGDLRPSEEPEPRARALERCCTDLGPVLLGESEEQLLLPFHELFPVQLEELRRVEERPRRVRRDQVRPVPADEVPPVLGEDDLHAASGPGRKQSEDRSRGSATSADTSRRGRSRRPAP